ncbi:MAG: carboxylating nicotinate-nucleotide diphosphorylase [Candidatus Caenarcaniphilales bacterium]|nr:carboxylating nicotinate-nucleotide diphosphorylase [Candidatus Caenarcaniphilales bacterium]
MYLFDQFIKLALAEDLEPAGDLTSDLLFAVGERGRLIVRSRSKAGIMSGESFVSRVYKLLDSSLIQIRFEVSEGSPFQSQSKLLTLEGELRVLLAGERLFLNLLQRACSVATYTAQFVKAVEGLSVQILDTRKTTPGLRLLEKQAVRSGGGYNHRFNLATGLMLKDNHLDLSKFSLKEAVRKVQSQQPYLGKLELEVDNLMQFEEALQVDGLERILLDNFSLPDLRQAVKLNQGRFSLEASGGISLESVRAIAETGVNFISVGALTQNPPLLDLGMDYELA